MPVDKLNSLLWVVDTAAESLKGPIAAWDLGKVQFSDSKLTRRLWILDSQKPCPVGLNTLIGKILSAY